jgi:proteasome accessory factor C
MNPNDDHTTTSTRHNSHRSRASAAGTSKAQVRRLLSLVPYLRAHDGVSVTEAAAAFNVSEKQIRGDLSVLWMCGLPGLSPGDLIDIDMDAVDGEGVIHLSNADYLTRPLRLSADEALALILALRTLANVAGSGEQDAIDRTLSKLQTVAGDRDATGAQTERAQVSIAGADDDVGAQILDGLQRGKRLDLTYDVASRAETTRRLVDPLRVFVLDGSGYLEAWCHSAQDLRRFRLDRIAAVATTDLDVAEHDVDLGDLSAGWFEVLKDAPLVTLALDRDAAWVAEYYPAESVTPAEDGAVTASMRISDPAWLRRLLLRLGGHGRVVAPEGAGDSAADAAAEALDQYAALAGRPSTA